MRISELISEFATSGNRSAIKQLEAKFDESVFGLLMSGLPKAKHGQGILVDGSGSVTMQYVTDPQGRRMIKACADPELFDVNYPGCINATLTGREIVEMLEKLPDADGILICSATSFHSFPLYKAADLKFEGTKPSDPPRKWWQLWKSA